MKKKIISLTILCFLLLGVSVIAQSHDRPIPDDMTGEEFKKAVSKANRGWFFGFFQSMLGGGDYWGMCTQFCWEYQLYGDCDACAPGEVETNCFWCEDQMTCFYPWSSAGDYCSDPFAPDPYYNKQCYCVVPEPECSGGGQPGDVKCSGGDVYECSNEGVWEFEENCEFECDDGECVGECDSSSDCGDDGLVGNPFCQDGDVYQLHRDYSCPNFLCLYEDTEQLIENCGADDCVGGECVTIEQPECTTNADCDAGYECINEECVLIDVGDDDDDDGDDDGDDDDNGDATADCETNEDCMTLAEVVCDDESLWHKSYSCVDGGCIIGEENPPTTCVSLPPTELSFLLEKVIGAILAIFLIGGIIFVVVKLRKK